MTIGVARSAEPYTLGVDCLEPVPEGIAEALYALGFRWIGRYLENLVREERDRLHGAKLAILPLIEMRLPNLLTGSFGQNVGNDSVQRAKALECPERVSVVTDLEATEATDSRDVIAYTNAVGRAVILGQYGSLLYVGAGQPLNGLELYQLVSAPYWRGASLNIPEVAFVGWSVLQLSPLEGLIIDGHKFDVSVVQTDARKRTPTLWWPA